MIRSLLAILTLCSVAASGIGCGGIQTRLEDVGQELKDRGVAFYEDVKAEVKKEVEARLPELKQAASDIVTEALEKQAEELKKKELAKLNAQLAMAPDTMTDPVTGEEKAVVRTWKDFDANSDGDIDEKELAEISKHHAAVLAKKVARGEISSGQAVEHATGTGITIATLFGIMMAKKGGRQALANLLRTGGSATGGVTG